MSGMRIPTFYIMWAYYIMILCGLRQRRGHYGINRIKDLCANGIYVIQTFKEIKIFLGYQENKDNL